MAQQISYANAGVDYSMLDPHKQGSLAAALATLGNARHGACVVQPWSMGESATLTLLPYGMYIGSVVEGLGTKSLVADAVAQETGQHYHYAYAIAIDTAAMVLNDLAAVGVQPVVYHQYLAVGASAWFENTLRRQGIIDGTKAACDFARCAWGGGETPALSGIVMEHAADLAGSALGIAMNHDRVINSVNIRAGDAIVLVESNGIHANGLSLARAVAGRMKHGYFEEIGGGQLFGDALLQPTLIYVGLVQRCLDDGAQISYAVHVTGHGWRKLMRAKQPFTYVLDQLPRPQAIFRFLQEQTNAPDRAMYETYNMGAGFALIVRESSVGVVLRAASELGLMAFVAGHVEAGPKRVVIGPLDIEYAADTLAVR